VCLIIVAVTTEVRHTWVNQVWPIMADRKQGAGLSSGSSAAVHKAHWCEIDVLSILLFSFSYRKWWRNVIL